MEQLFANPVFLVNLYAPNCVDIFFFEKQFLTILKINDGYFIIGGYFNLVLDVTLDKSSNKQV